MRRFEILIGDHGDTLTLLGEGKVLVEANYKRKHDDLTKFWYIMFYNSDQLGPQEDFLSRYMYKSLLIDDTLKAWEASLC